MTIPQWRPDPTFYPSPRMAMEAPSEKLAYLALLNPKLAGKPDTLAVVDVDPTSRTYSQVVGQVEMPNAGDELHHFGWNACSSCLSPYAPHAHMERRYLIVPGIRSSRILVIDTKPDPRQPKIVKVIEPETLARRTGYSRPHTVHCGPDGIYVSALGSTTGEGPGGIFIMDPESFDVLGKWELDRGPQYLAYDFWWHLGCGNQRVGNPENIRERTYPGRAAQQWLWPCRAHLGPAPPAPPAGSRPGQGAPVGVRATSGP